MCSAQVTSLARLFANFKLIFPYFARSGIRGQVELDPNLIRKHGFSPRLTIKLSFVVSNERIIPTLNPYG